MPPAHGNRRKCGAPTANGGTCSNYWDTCPHESHKHRRPRAGSRSATHESLDVSAIQIGLSGSDNRAVGKLAAETGDFGRLLDRASDAYGFPREMIAHDYWLVATLYAWATRVGVRSVPLAYPPAGSSPPPAGRVIFGGGTSLSASWGITERWSEDIDLVFEPDGGKHIPKKFKAACKAAAITVSKAIGGAYNTAGRSKNHFFFEVVHKDGPQARSHVDIVAHDGIAHPVLVQYTPVMSLIGKLAEPDELAAYPELGGFDFLTLGPGSTAMNKLLAQTQVSELGDLRRIRERARDVYDLASIALSSAYFEGHIGRDSSALLYVAEQWQGGKTSRPPDGFASLRSFTSGTREHEVLAEGYETMTNQMVWGEKIEFDEAIRLAVSLDPGPAKKFEAPPPDDHHGIGYPRFT